MCKTLSTISTNLSTFNLFENTCEVSEIISTILSALGNFRLFEAFIFILDTAVAHLWSFLLSVTTILRNYCPHAATLVFY